MADSKIEWTEKTWNPVVGCSKVSPGCAHCYAETMDHRIRGVAGEEWKPWTPENAAYNVRLHPERLTAPLHWKKPCRVFVNSMSDLFHEAVPFEFIDRVFAVMALTPHITYQVLTKRPERMREYLSDPLRCWAWTDAYGPLIVSGAITAAALNRAAEHPERDGTFVPFPLPNVWLGTSVENQHWADIRIPELLATPAAVRFLSCEPLLGPLDIEGHLKQWRCPDCGRRWASEPTEWFTLSGAHKRFGPPTCIGLFKGECLRETVPAISWVIVGGESGSGARPTDLAWVRSIVQQCQAAGVACFVKQLGSGYVHDSEYPRGNGLPEFSMSAYARRKSRKGGDMSEWPEDLRIRQFPEVRHA